MKIKYLLALARGILLLSVLGIALVVQRPDTRFVEIVQDGNILYRLDLSETDDRILEVEYAGRFNRIEIRDHQIHMLDAQCPDQTCIHMGWLDSAVPIVCLPNRLVIRFVEVRKGFDGVAG